MHAEKPTTFGSSLFYLGLRRDGITTSFVVDS